jgi:hypothetical protein
MDAPIINVGEGYYVDRVAFRRPKMIDARTAPYAALALRLTLGALFLAHAGLKLFVFTPAGTAQFFAKLGLPPALAYLTIAVEILGALCLSSVCSPASPPWSCASC